MLINVKMPTIVGILTFMSRINFVLSCVEHGKSFITSGPGVVSIFSTVHLRANIFVLTLFKCFGTCACIYIEMNAVSMLGTCACKHICTDCASVFEQGNSLKQRHCDTIT